MKPASQPDRDFVLHRTSKLYIFHTKRISSLSIFQIFQSEATFKKSKIARKMKLLRKKEPKLKEQDVRKQGSSSVFLPPVLTFRNAYFIIFVPVDLNGLVLGSYVGILTKNGSRKANIFLHNLQMD